MESIAEKERQKLVDAEKEIATESCYCTEKSKDSSPHRLVSLGQFMVFEKTMPVFDSSHARITAEWYAEYSHLYGLQDYKTNRILYNDSLHFTSSIEV